METPTTGSKTMRERVLSGELMVEARLSRTAPVGEMMVIEGLEDASALLREYYEGRDREEFVVMLMDARNRLHGLHRAHVGGPMGVSTNPVCIMRPILLTGAVRVVLAHNHPFGDAEPSEDDRNASKDIKKILDMFGIDLVDTLIVGAGGDVYSFRMNEDDAPCDCASCRLKRALRNVREGSTEKVNPEGIPEPVQKLLEYIRTEMGSEADVRVAAIPMPMTNQKGEA